MEMQAMIKKMTQEQLVQQLLKKQQNYEERLI